MVSIFPNVGGFETVSVCFFLISICSIGDLFTSIQRSRSENEWILNASALFNESIFPLKPLFQQTSVKRSYLQIILVRIVLFSKNSFLLHFMRECWWRFGFFYLLIFFLRNHLLLSPEQLTMRWGGGGIHSLFLRILQIHWIINTT